jgi:hypothetical protein
MKDDKSPREVAMAAYKAADEHGATEADLKVLSAQAAQCAAEAQGWSTEDVGQAAANATRAFGGSVEEASHAAMLAAAHSARDKGLEDAAVSDSAVRAKGTAEEKLESGGALAEEDWSDYRSIIGSRSQFNLLWIMLPLLGLATLLLIGAYLNHRAGDRGISCEDISSLQGKGCDDMCMNSGSDDESGSDDGDNGGEQTGSSPDNSMEKTQSPIRKKRGLGSTASSAPRPYMATPCVDPSSSALPAAPMATVLQSPQVYFPSSISPSGSFYK